MNSLYRRLLFMTLMPACFLSLVLAVYFSLAGLHALEDELLQRGEDMVRYMAPSSEYGVVSGNWLSLQGMVQGAVQQPDVRAAAVVSSEGRVLAVSGRINLGTEYLQVTPHHVGQVATGDAWIAFAAPILRSQVGDDLFFEAPGAQAEVAPEVVGQVFVELDKSDLFKRQRELLLRATGILLLALVVAAYFVARLARHLVQPVAQLVDAVRAMADGRFDTRVQESSQDEIGELERGFNRMSEHIDDVHRNLQYRIDEATALLAYQARHDVLTGLINRREFETRLEAAIKVAQGGGEVSAVLFIDLDRFKRVNDTSGHMAGDELLRQLSRQLQSRLRESDTLARLGGDEFGVLLPGNREEGATRLAQGLCHLVSSFHFAWQDKVFTVGASIGVVMVDAESRSVSEVLSAGDRACYAAKAGGRNRVEVFERSQQDFRIPDQDPWRDRLVQVLDQGGLHFYVQGIGNRNPVQSHLSLFELSAAIDDAQGKELPLALLAESVERYDLAHVLDQQLLSRAVQLLLGLVEAGGVHSSGNQRQPVCLLRISGVSMRHPDFLLFMQQQLLRLVRALGDRQSVTQGGLCLLVSEEAAILYPSEMAHFCKLVREQHGWVGLDDFGGWMNSFSHLRQIAPDYMRITPSMLKDVGSNRSSAALVRAVQEIADDHHIMTVATCADDPQTVKRLQELGMDHLQGQAVSPKERLEGWLAGLHQG